MSASVAESLSSCDSKGTGGDLGWISPGLMVPEFDAAAFTFTPGELATIKSDLGWHVLRVAEASYLEAEMAPAASELSLILATADALTAVAAVESAAAPVARVRSPACARRRLASSSSSPSASPSAVVAMNGRVR